MKRFLPYALAALFIASGVVFGLALGAVFDDDEAPVALERPLRATAAAEPVPLGKPASAPRAADPVPADVLTLNALFKRVAADVTPAVVSIEVELQREDRRGNNERDFFFRPRPSTSAGSGVVVSEAGYIVTNNHVVADARNIVVLLNDKREYQAQIIGTDPSTDLAVIKIEEPGELPVVAIGDSDALEVGEWVMAVGNPFRLTSTVTAGIVSALGRQVNIIEDSFGIEDFIQTDAAINPGNSGGALVNLKGELVGINTAIATESGSYEGYGFAVPVKLMERIATDLIQFGEVKRGFLGVSLADVNARIANDLGLDRIEGVLIRGVQGGTAADRAGLEEDDIILAVDGDPIYATNQLQAEIAQRRPGDDVAFDVWRNGRVRPITVRLFGRDDDVYQDWVADLDRQRQPLPAPDLEAEPAPEGERFEEQALGIALRELSAREKRAFGVEQGAYVIYVRGDSPADVAGLPRDVALTHIADHPVASADDAIKMLTAMRTLRERAERTDGLLVRVQRRDGTTAFYDIELSPPAR